MGSYKYVDGTVICTEESVMSHKIKVLQSVSSLGVGGNVTFVMNFFRKIDKEKFQIDFLIYDDSKMDYYDEVKSAGSNIFVVKRKYKNKTFNLFSQMWQVRKILKNENYDIIHCHSCSFFGIFKGAIPGYFNSKVKVISHSHNPGMPKNTLLDNIARSISKKFLSHIVDMGFSCSDYAGESKYTDEFMKSDKYKIIHNAIHVENYVYNNSFRETIRNSYNIGDRVLIGNVGRLAKQKNQSFLLDIFAKIKQINKDTMLIIIGGGELEKQLKDKAVNLGIIDSVIFTGSVNDVNKYYSAMDVFVMPSLYEGLPFTAIEAQVNGLKCVISDKVTKMTDASGETKFISLEDSIDKWSDTILKSAESRISSEKVSNVTANYNIYTEVKKLEELYTEI